MSLRGLLMRGHPRPRNAWQGLHKLRWGYFLMSLCLTARFANAVLIFAPLALCLRYAPAFKSALFLLLGVFSRAFSFFFLVWFAFSSFCVRSSCFCAFWRSSCWFLCSVRSFVRSWLFFRFVWLWVALWLLLGLLPLSSSGGWSFGVGCSCSCWVFSPVRVCLWAGVVWFCCCSCAFCSWWSWFFALRRAAFLLWRG